MRVPADLAAIRAACPTCAAIPLFVTEFGSAIPGNLLDAYIGGFPQFPYLAAELIQAVDLNLSTMAYFAFEHNSSDSWFATPGLSHPIYEIYSTILSRLGPELLPVNVSTSMAGIYALATTGNSSSSPIDLLVDNANATGAISFSTSQTGLNASGPIESWSWNSSSLEPVAQYWPTGLPATWKEPPASLVLFEQPRIPTYPLVITETGMPASTRWYVGVGNVTGTSNSSRMTFFLPSGEYRQAAYGAQYPKTGERIIFSLPADVVIKNAPVTEAGTYGLQYRVATSASPESEGSASPSSQ